MRLDRVITATLMLPLLATIAFACVKQTSEPCDPPNPAPHFTIPLDTLHDVRGLVLAAGILVLAGATAVLWRQTDRMHAGLAFGGTVLSAALFRVFNSPGDRS